MWEPPGDIQPQTKSDLLRLLLLYRFGGVWIDTDTILLQDMRPIVQFLGGFGGRFAMNQKYNNAMIGTVTCLMPQHCSPVSPASAPRQPVLCHDGMIGTVA